MSSPSAPPCVIVFPNLLPALPYQLYPPNILFVKAQHSQPRVLFHLNKQSQPERDITNMFFLAPRKITLKAPVHNSNDNYICRADFPNISQVSRDIDFGWAQVRVGGVPNFVHC